MEPGGTLVENLVEPWWKEPSCNLTSNHPGPPRSPRKWWNPGRAAPDPAALADGGTLVKPSWNLTSGPPRTTPQPSQMVEPWWNPGGTLVEPYFRDAPDHPGACLG